MSNKIKIIITIIIIAILIGIVVIFGNKKENNNIEIEKEKYEYFTLYSLDDKVGVINKEGNKIIDTKFSDIYIPNQAKDVFVCISNGTSKVLDGKEKELFNEFDEVSCIIISQDNYEVEKDVLKYKKNDKYGLLDLSGKILSDPIYDEVSSLENKPGSILVKKDGKYGIINFDGEKILEVKYNSIKSDEYCSEKDGYSKTGYIISEKSKNGIIYGYADFSGNIIIEPKYEYISRALEYDEDSIYLIVMNNGKKGVLKDTKQIIKNNFQSINYYNMSNIFVVNKNGKYGFYNNSGKEILKPEFTSYSVAGKYISVKKDDSTMLYDIHGNLVNSQNYKSIIEIENDSYFIAQYETGEYSIIGKDIQIDDKFSGINYAFDDNFIVLNSEGKYGVLNAYKGMVISAEYDYILKIGEIKALEAKKDKIVDVYSNSLDKVLTVSDGIVENQGTEYAVIYSNNEMQYINKNGEIVQNTEVYPNAKMYAYQDENKKWGFVDKNGKIIVNCKYDIVTEFNEYGFAGICQDGKWGVLDEKGKELVIPSYEIETYYFPKFVGKYLLDSLYGNQCVELEE